MGKGGEHLKTYTPKPCEGDDSLFEGQVVLALPSYDERMDLLIDNPSFFDDVEPSGSMKRLEDLKKSRAVSKWSYQFYRKVDIKRKSDGFHFKSLEDLQRSNDCTAIIADVANRLSVGFDLGN